ncbi:hypothetical protein CF326_g3197 [Tilletia indica]|nr:hypothetical protein CF326_g3197 [Tilletia indica]
MSGLNAFNARIDCATGTVTVKNDEGVRIKIQAVKASDPATTTRLVGVPRPTVEDADSDSDSDAVEMQGHRIKQMILLTTGLWAKKPSTYHFNTKRKAVADKIRPVALPPLWGTASGLRRPDFDRDPYATPLTAWPPVFEPTSKLTMERIESLYFGHEGFINEAEKALLLHVLRLREDVLAFERSDKRFLNPAYADPYEIRTIDNVPWVDRTLPYPKAKRQEIISMLQEQLRSGDLEFSNSLYVTSHFFVPKKDGSMRMIIDMRSANAVTIRDSNVPPILADYVDNCVGRVCISCADGYSFYDQRMMSENSRSMTAMRTPVGHVQKVGLPQGGTNAPAEAQRISVHVRGAEVPEVMAPSIDDYPSILSWALGLLTTMRPFLGVQCASGCLSML